MKGITAIIRKYRHILTIILALAGIGIMAYYDYCDTTCSYLKKGIEPSKIPAAAADEVLQWVYDQSDDAMFKVEPKPDFKYTPVKGSFSKAKCSLCHEYVFERYVRIKEGQLVCIPCSGIREKINITQSESPCPMTIEVTIGPGCSYRKRINTIHLDTSSG